MRAERAAILADQSVLPERGVGRGAVARASRRAARAVVPPTPKPPKESRSPRERARARGRARAKKTRAKEKDEVRREREPSPVEARVEARLESQAGLATIVDPRQEVR